MSNTMEQSRLISHAIAAESDTAVLQKITHRIQQTGDKPHVTVEKQLELLNQLMEFDFGKFLLKNQGINGYWTHYMLTHPWIDRKTDKNNAKKPFSDIERFILDRAPLMLATQQRFQIFLAESQTAVKNQAKLASIPCGLLGELLYLDFSAIDQLQLFGIDYDATTLDEAKILAETQQLSHLVHLIQSDAWQLNMENEFDLITSNGLNIYEPDDDRVTTLYQQFYQALKPNGKLITSFMTHPPGMSTQCEWIMEKINLQDLLLQRIIFIDIIDLKCQYYRSTQQTMNQLQSVGFKNIQFIYDTARMFPTVIATKSNK